MSMSARIPLDKPVPQMEHEIDQLFGAGLPWNEAWPMVISRFHPQWSAFRARWMDWEAERRARNTAIMCGNG
jgi:hypothetical protein